MQNAHCDQIKRHMRHLFIIGANGLPVTPKQKENSTLTDKDKRHFQERSLCCNIFPGCFNWKLGYSLKWPDKHLTKQPGANRLQIESCYQVLCVLVLITNPNVSQNSQVLSLLFWNICFVQNRQIQQWKFTAIQSLWYLYSAKWKDNLRMHVK